MAIVIKRIARPDPSIEALAVHHTANDLFNGREVRDGDVSAVREWGGTYLVDDGDEHPVAYRTAAAAAQAFCGASWRAA